MRRRLGAIEAGRDDICRADHETAVISAEDLSVLPAADLARLRACLGNDVRVVFVLRRWSGLLPSLAAEDIRQGSTRTLPEILFAHVAAPFASEAVNPAIRLNRLAEVFGIGNLHVLAYDEIIRQGMDLFGVFLDAVLGLTDPPPFETAIVHPSASMQDAELLRLANVMRRLGRLTPQFWRPDHFLRAARHNGFIDLLPLMEPAAERLTIDDRIRPFSGLHRTIAETFGAAIAGPRQADPNRLFVPERRAVSYVATSYLMAPRAVELALSVCAAACAEACGSLDKTPVDPWFAHSRYAP